MIDKENINSLYGQPFPSTRSGALFNAFSYPTKISPEAIALFIACHTNPGDYIFDPFGGSGTTGIATKLCDKPTDKMLSMASTCGAKPQWGPRNAIVYELSPIASAIGETICNTSSTEFEKYAKLLLCKVEKRIGHVYTTRDPEGNIGYLRHVIWSDKVECPHCKERQLYAKVAVRHNPVAFLNEHKCEFCGENYKLENCSHVLSNEADPITGELHRTKDRVPYKIYGTTGTKKWCRIATENDFREYNELIRQLDFADIPIQEMNWGDLYRSGYHCGIKYVHQMYTARNAFVLSQLFKEIEMFPQNIQQALKVFVLSYNQSHSTLMTRVVAKRGNKDFVLTGAQSGVLYISSLPVEKNILEGLRRKIKTFKDSLILVEGSRSIAQFINGTSVKTDIPDNVLDYVFTDPPFGDYIPYSEINQINEAWFGIKTNNTDEVIINSCQNKGNDEYHSLMTGVFSEVHRSLKPNGLCTVVFHSAKAEIWRNIVSAYQKAGLCILKTGILDKVQASFKQINSTITVKGDPLLLLTKGTIPEICKVGKDTEIAQDIIKAHSNEVDSKEKSEIMFSEYIAQCIEQGIQISLNAEYFFAHGK